MLLPCNLRYCISTILISYCFVSLRQFYMWLHTTFRYLVTKEHTFHLKVSEIMKQALLRRRFDSVTANHIGTLWDRVTAGVNEYLREVEHKIAYECEDIQVGFDKLENAPLVALLSEGDHPTDGNDVLFLIINDIIGAYNNFARRIAECVSSDACDSTPSQELHPKFVATGCGGAVAMSAAMPLSASDLTMLVASYWNSDQKCYDLTSLGNALHRELGLRHSPPVISNPSKCLRECFRFRDDRLRPLVDSGMNASMLTGEDGEYFANHQDYHLARDVRHSLLAVELFIGDAGIRRTLVDNFYSFDYNQLRLMLEGCRSLLASVSMEFVDFDSVEQALRIASSDQISDFNVVQALQSFGFPELRLSQAQLLVTLDAAQFVELVKFLSYQLASESHLFANLPLCMTDPLKDADREEIDSRLEDLLEDRSAKKVVELIDEFTRDILSFYELQIREAASSNRSLKGFLADENFCDDKVDPVFALLPTRVSLRNYVSLRQHLHQQKLRFLSSEPIATTNGLNRNIDSKTIDLVTRPSRGRCWLWEDDEMDDEEALDEEGQVHSAPYNENWSLWFETREDYGEEMFGDEMIQEAGTMARREDEAAKSSMDDIGSDESDAKSMEIDEEEAVDREGDGNEAFSARTLQRWWRRQRAEFDRGNDLLDVDGLGYMFVIDDDDDEAEDIFDSDETEQNLITHDVMVETLNTATEHGASSIEGHWMQGTFEDSPGTVIQYANPQLEAPPIATTEQGVSSGDSSEEVEPTQISLGQHTDTELQSTGEQRRSLDLHMYGNVEEEQAMRQWLNDNRWPQTVADELVELGARNIVDVVDLVESYEDLLGDLNMKPMDRAKLLKAVKAHMNAT